MIVQKYLHDLAGWNALATEAQERIIGRTKLADIELDDAVKPTSAHNALTTIVEDGKEIKILRHNMAFGRPGRASSAPISSVTPFAPDDRADAGEHVRRTARRATTIALLDFSRAVTGNLSSCRPRRFWRTSRPTSRTQPSAAPDRPMSRAPPTPVRDGSLGIGSLKGVHADE